ncbi:MAG: hypothetical protein KGN79_02490 [Acidobacteriota bacterium]|nr:hypothetical protein [Acidobacteriota bacterium]
MEAIRETAAEDVRGQVGTALAAERAVNGDPGIRHGEEQSGNVLATALAVDGEVVDSGVWQVEHGTSIGEYKAKIFLKVLHSEGGGLAQLLRYDEVQ